MALKNRGGPGAARRRLAAAAAVALVAVPSVGMADSGVVPEGGVGASQSYTVDGVTYPSLAAAFAGVVNGQRPPMAKEQVVAEHRVFPLLAGKPTAEWSEAIQAGDGTFDDALMVIAPISSAQGIAVLALSGETHVSWRAGTRLAALRDVLEQVHARAVIGEDRVTIEPVAMAAKARVLHIDASKPDASKADAGAVRARPKVAVPEMHEWALNAGETLRAALDRWATQARWTVVWPSSVPDYPVIAGAVYRKADFLDAAQALFGDLAAQSVDLRGHAYSNQVITVSTTTEISK